MNKYYAAQHFYLQTPPKIKQVAPRVCILTQKVGSMVENHNVHPLICRHGVLTIWIQSTGRNLMFSESGDKTAASANNSHKRLSLLSSAPSLTFASLWKIVGKAFINPNYTLSCATV